MGELFIPSGLKEKAGCHLDVGAGENLAYIKWLLEKHPEISVVALEKQSQFYGCEEIAASIRGKIEVVSGDALIFLRDKRNKGRFDSVSCNFPDRDLMLALIAEKGALGEVLKEGGHMILSLNSPRKKGGNISAAEKLGEKTAELFLTNHPLEVVQIQEISNKILLERHTPIDLFGGATGDTHACIKRYLKRHLERHSRGHHCDPFNLDGEDISIRQHIDERLAGIFPYEIVLRKKEKSNSS